MSCSGDMHSPVGGNACDQAHKVVYSIRNREGAGRDFQQLLMGLSADRQPYKHGAMIGAAGTVPDLRFERIYGLVVENVVKADKLRNRQGSNCPRSGVDAAEVGECRAEAPSHLSIRIRVASRDPLIVARL